MSTEEKVQNETAAARSLVDQLLRACCYIRGGTTRRFWISWFPKPKSGRIAMKVINHLGDEVMKVFKV